MEQNPTLMFAGTQEPHAYGCVSCAAGHEAAVIRRMRNRAPSIRAFAAMRVKHKVIDGVHASTSDVMLPGYVFFEAPESFDSVAGFRLTSVHRVLCTDKDEWRLQGSDLAFAKWLLERNGMLGLSTAYREDGKVCFVSGPLKEMAGAISKVVWRAGRAQVKIPFDGQLFMVWLSFDRIDPPSARMEGAANVQARHIHGTAVSGGN